MPSFFYILFNERLYGKERIMQNVSQLMFGIVLGCSVLTMPLVGHATDSSSTQGQATLLNKEKESVGKAKVRDVPHGLVIHLNVTQLPEGTHAFHIHETGTCEAPDFKSAGGHLNPGNRKHGLLDPKGFHVGDMPNIHVSEKGQLEVEIFVPEATLTEGKQSLMDKDGAALVVHEGRDDYQTDPAGDAGPRIACGVIEKQ
jgi:superoxide dismutase, Cu-Zn family